MSKPVQVMATGRERRALNSSPRYWPGNRIHQELIGLELEERIPALLAEALEPFPEAGLDLDRIGRYFEALKVNYADLFDYLRMSLEP